MAIVKFDRSLFRNGNKAKGMNYGQIEPNQTWFNRDGMVEAQCYLDPDQFADDIVAPLTKYVAATSSNGVTTPATKIVAQDGAFLMVDKSQGLATIPSTAGSEAGFPMGINYSSEQMYDERTPQRRKFFLTTEKWLPRIGYTAPGMRLTTNTVQWDTTCSTVDLSGCTTSDDSFTAFTAIKNYINAGNKNAPLYACVVDGSDGELVIGADPADALGNVYAEVVAAYDNADRTCSFMFQFINKPTA
jgi:hypothetical protein